MRSFNASLRASGRPLSNRSDSRQGNHRQEPLPRELTHAATRWQNVFDAEILELLMWAESHELREGRRRL